MLNQFNFTLYEGYYTNGSYEMKGTPFLTNIKNENDGIGPVGETYVEIINPDEHFTIRKFNYQKYPAYYLVMSPKENTQEAYDQLFELFDSKEPECNDDICIMGETFDEIGIERNLSQPNITRRRGNLKSEFVDKQKELLAYNLEISCVNDFIGTCCFFIINDFEICKDEDLNDKLKKYCSGESDVKIPIPDNIKGYEKLIMEFIDEMIEHRNENCLMDFSERYYLTIVNTEDNNWYEYHYDVDFTAVKLEVKCHDQSLIYSIINDWVTEYKSN